MTTPAVGDVLHGFCGGAFGRDSYDCRLVEATGHDWIVTRNSRREVELCTGRSLRGVAEAGADRSYCYDDCQGAPPLNDIDMTGECCCAGCIGMGPCDLEPLGSSDEDDEWSDP
jgi:hypothetical protein